MLPLLCLASGVLVHLSVFRHGEWETRSPQVVLSYLFVALGGTLCLRPSNSTTANDVSGLGPTSFVRLLAFHMIGLFASITVYRLFFHKLAGFRGPFIARLSSFYLAWLSAKRLHLHDEIDYLHSRYGDYVRTGPRELSIIDPQSVQVIYGSQTKCIKGPIYTLLDPRTNLSSTRDKTEHAKRRRTWDRGFSTAALHTYEPMVQELTEELMTIIDELSENPINITEWVDKYAFEVMGQLTFGKPFNMLKERKEAYFLEVIRHDMNAIGYLLNLPWLSYLFLRTPGLNQNHLNFWKWIENEFVQRIARGQRRPDVFNWLHQAYLQGPQMKSDTLKLHGDGYLVIVAGSDTTASTITHLLFYLACNKALMQKLQAQLDALDELKDESLRNIELLDACINETLRLRPAVPAGVQRETPKEGIYIGNRYIPGNTIVKVPMYTLFRDPRSFEQPNEFIPERFTTRPELVKDKSVFIPFLTGSYACVGRRLALMEVRRAVAAILCRYDIALAQGQTEEGFLDGKIDAFTLVAAPLSLKFTRRHQQKQ